MGRGRERGGGLPLLRDGLQAIGGTAIRGPILNFVQCEDTHKPVAERLLHDVIVVDDLNKALDVWQETPRKTFVTLDGDILEPDGTLTGGAGEVELGSVLRQRREMKELEEIITDLERQYDGAMEAHVSVKTEISSLNSMLAALTDEGHQHDKEALTKEKDLSGIRSECEQLAARRSTLESRLNEIHDALTRLDLEDVQRKDQHAIAAVNARGMREGPIAGTQKSGATQQFARRICSNSWSVLKLHSLN